MAIRFNRAIILPLAGLILALQAFVFKASMVLAQDAPKQVDVNVDIKGPGAGGTVWYGNWWVWAIGIGVFLIIIVALTSRNRSSTIIEKKV